MTKTGRKYLYDFVGSKIKTLRNNAGMSQQELADKLSMSRVSIVNIEKGRQQLTLHLLFEICYIFGAELNTFFPKKEDDNDVSSKIHKEVEQIKESTGQRISSKKLIDFIDKVGSKKTDK